ncbi:hypothetical protein [Martelella mangrovi]|uniref:Uncharacterized protein n=1 Tax=Martelella mangrovi TaxID=1397477 RepID=A0ABV2IE16_9HYPH
MEKNELPTIPAISDELLSALDRRFPERCPDAETPDREIWMAAGKRHLVRFLLAEKARQDQQSMKGSVL